MLLVVSVGLAGQPSVSLLRGAPTPVVVEAGAAAAGEQSFDFSRNLIYFPAELDGRPGHYILDTGAPSLLLNDRGAGAREPGNGGVAVGGAVELGHRRVSNFRMAGRDYGGRTALSLDLRRHEDRSGRPLDGYVGYDLIGRGELRIDYPNRTFVQRASERRPRHAGRAPAVSWRFALQDHLPVVALRVGGRKLYFVIDTGAGVSLLDRSVGGLGRPTGRRTNVLGLSGPATDHPVVELANPVDPAARVPFVVMDLAELRAPGQPPIAGILGSDFLGRYCVGIDYRRQRVNLWPATETP